MRSEPGLAGRSWGQGVTEYGWSLLLSVVATAVAVVAFARTFSRELPTVEFLVERDENEEFLYRLAVSNPTHRLLVLNEVEVRLPDAEGVKVRPIGVTLQGTLERAYEEDVTMASKRRKSVYLAVPAGETRSLEVEFPDEQTFEVAFRLHWSKGLPVPERWFIARKVRLDCAHVKSRQLAAVARSGLAGSCGSGMG